MRRIALLAGTLGIGVLAPSPAAASEPIPAECPPVFFADAGDVDCFHIDVPEHHEDPDGPPITLFVSIMRANGGNPAPDPVVYLAGGPGAPAAEAARMFAEASTRDARDIILVEQRGTALTVPYLGCPALDIEGTFFSADPSYPELSAERIGAAAAECAASHEADGTDLGAYTTAASAADLEVVRQVLGVEVWNLYGGSYGTRLALEVLRRHPESVRSAVLDSVDPPGSPRLVNRTPNLVAAFEALSAACAADGACSDRFGDLDALLRRSFDRWRAEPTTVFVRYSEDAQTSFLVDHGAVAGMVYANLVGDPTILPLHLEQVAAGDTTVFELLDLRPGILSEGLRLSIECSETISHADVDEVLINDATNPELALAFRSFPEPFACPSWPVSPASTEAVQPVESDVPILLVSGSLDPLTPPSSAALAAATLARSHHHIVAGGGHGAGFTDPCAIAVRDAFLDDPSAAKVDCESSATFLTDVVDVPSIAATWRAMLVPTLVPSTPMPLVILAIGAGLVISVALAVVMLLRGSRPRAMALVGVSAATMIGLGAVLAWVWLALPPVVGMVGLPSALAWVPWVIPIVAVLGVVAIVAVVVTVAIRGSAGRRERWLMVVAVVPVLAGVWVLAANGLVVPPL